MPTAITSGVATFTIGSGGFYFMGEDEVLATTGHGITTGEDNVDLFVNGQIYSDDRGIFFLTSGNSIDLTLGADASVVGVNEGLRIGSDNTDVVNYGSITSLNSIGVNIEFSANGDTAFVNYGSVSGHSTGLEIAGLNQVAVNHGAIDGRVGVRLAESDTQFVNYGTVTGTSSVFSGDLGIGLFVLPSEGGSENGIVIKNFGTITGTGKGIVSGDAAENLLIRNHGLIVGDVELAKGNDTYLAGAEGVVVGGIFTDEGDDFVRGGHHADDIDGGADNDILLGRGGDDIIFGDTGNDEIKGGSGDDDIDGGSGRDLLKGGKDDDVLSGAAGADTLFGGQGDDTLFGGGSADILHGGKGDDELTGGNGDDVFVFEGNDGRDTITDFINGQDKIDLSDFGQITFANLTSNFTIGLHGPTGSFIDFGNGDVLILENMNIGNLDSSDFIF
ncbi:hypothetical protein N9O61_01040 [Octadecabacter sp.]|nr:hypothetical protein [Octadecabacter sp.]